MEPSTETFRRGRWTLRFVNREIEEAFLKSRIEGFLLYFGRILVIPVVAVLPKFVHDLRLYMGGGVELEVPEAALLVAYGIVLLFSLVCIAASRLPWSQRLLGFRGTEVLVTILGLMLATIWCALPSMIEEDGSEDRALYRNAMTGLGLDVMVTVMHLVIPVRWHVAIWNDGLFVMLFAVYGVVKLEKFDWNAFSAFAGLIIGACFGLRSHEGKERRLFATVVDERTLRAAAEFNASRNNSKGSRREHDVCSVPSTTDTAAIFSASSEEIKELGLAEQWLIQAEELAVYPDQVLGKGGQGYCVEGKFCGSPVAVKAYNRVANTEMFNELRILRHVRHPNIALFHGACISSKGDEFMLVLERVNGISLERYMAALSQRDPGLLAQEQNQVTIMQCICQSLMYLHSRRPCIVHADLKPGNVLIESREGPWPKLLDFGLSRTVTRNAVHRGGTPLYMAPEIIQGRAFRPSPAADVFSLGRLLYFVGGGRKPTTSGSAANARELATQIRHGELPAYSWDHGPELLQRWRTVIEVCSDAAPEKRPVVQDVHVQLFDPTPSGKLSSCKFSASESGEVQSIDQDLNDCGLPHDLVAVVPNSIEQALPSSVGDLSAVKPLVPDGSWRTGGGPGQSADGRLLL